MWEKINFKELDSMISFRYVEDLYDRIKELNYNYVSEFIYTNYYLFKNSLSQMNDELSLSRSCCLHWMNTWNFPVRNPGGNQYSKRRD